MCLRPVSSSTVPMENRRLPAVLVIQQKTRTFRRRSGQVVRCCRGRPSRFGRDRLQGAGRTARSPQGRGCRRSGLPIEAHHDVEVSVRSSQRQPSHSLVFSIPKSGLRVPIRADFRIADVSSRCVASERTGRSRRGRQRNGRVGIGIGLLAGGFIAHCPRGGCRHRTSVGLSHAVTRNNTGTQVVSHHLATVPPAVARLHPRRPAG